MLHLFDRATMAHALTLDLDVHLHHLLSTRLAALGEDLIDWTEYLIVEPGDAEADIVRHIGFSPLVEPYDGARWNQPGFHPWWDWLANHGGWFEMIVTFGSTFAYVLFIRDIANAPNELPQMCQYYCPT